MIATREQIQQFYDYALRELPQQPELSLDELFDRWRLEHPTNTEKSANIAAVTESLDDLAAGVTPRPFEEFSRDFRHRNAIISK